MISVNMREMLEAGAHFGHQVRRWNPRMKPYIFTKKNGIYIINLQTSIEMFKSSLQVIEDTASKQDVLIVGTKKQAQSIVEKVSEECGLHYVDKRWIGGLLTNFPLIRKNVERLLELEEMKNDGRWDVKSKKEQSKLEKIYKKLKKSLWGVRNMTELPGLLLVIDTHFEEIAVNEAKKLKIPIVGIVDTNADPEEIDYPIPGNDDAIRSIKLFVTKFGEAFKSGREKRLEDSLEISKETRTEDLPEEEIEATLGEEPAVKEEGKIEAEIEEKVTVEEQAEKAVEEEVEANETVEAETKAEEKARAEVEAEEKVPEEERLEAETGIEDKEPVEDRVKAEEKEKVHTEVKAEPEPVAEAAKKKEIKTTPAKKTKATPKTSQKTGATGKEGKKDTKKEDPAD